MANGLSNEEQDVPEELVGTQVQALVYSGITQVECSKQPDGKWTIRSD